MACRTSSRFLKACCVRVCTHQRRSDPALTSVSAFATDAEFPERLEIPLPPLEEQRRIVAEIEGYQKVLDGARQILAGYKLDSTTGLANVARRVCDSITARLSRAPKDPRRTCPRPRIVHPPRSCHERTTISDANLTEGHAEIYAERAFCKAATIATRHAAHHRRRFCCAGTGIESLTNIVAFRSSTRNADRSSAHACSQASSQICARRRRGAQQHQHRRLRELEIPLPPLSEQRRIVAELDAEAAQMEAVRALLPRFEAKIQRVLDRVWGPCKSKHPSCARWKNSISRTSSPSWSKRSRSGR